MTDDLIHRLRQAASRIPTPEAGALARRIAAHAGPLPRPRPAAPRPGIPWTALAAAAVVAVAMALALRTDGSQVVVPAPAAVVVADPLMGEIDALRRDLGQAGAAVGDLIAWERFAPGLPAGGRSP
ncbi:MAG: hypothetical protein RLZZ127_674 [Planctomycetota bacterium]|jgi:hypothetical protein